jgi:hypothetical protein
MEGREDIWRLYIQGDSKLLSGFPWPINGNPDNNLEYLCTYGHLISVLKFVMMGEYVQISFCLRPSVAGNKLISCAIQYLITLRITGYSKKKTRKHDVSATGSVSVLR